MIQANPTGLFVGKQKAVPLTGVRVAAEVRGLCSRVTVTQRYWNPEKQPLEAVYVFPLPEGAAVCGFEVLIGDQLVVGRVEEREKAFAEYDDALADGLHACLLDQERPNVFTASVGNLLPGQTVIVRLTYVELLAREGTAVRLLVPTTVSPRYVPPKGKPKEVGEPDGDRVNPPREFDVPYGLCLEVDVDAGGPVRRLECPSHPVRITTRERGATVELSSGTVALDRDFVLLVEPAEPFSPTAALATEADGTRVAQVTFHPDLTAEGTGSHEVLFLVDCSGSMTGDSIEQARAALALCVRALEEGDTFDLVRFGSGFEPLWGEARAFTEASLARATAWIDGTDSSLGGTEILEPLAALLSRPVDPQRSRQVLLLTDGEVSNEAEIIALCEEHADSSRVFTFGIGAGASELLVRGVARASRGACEMIFPGERIAPKVLRMFDRVRSPSLRNLRVDWGGLEVEQAPARVPPIFAGDTLTIFGRVLTGSASQVTLIADDRRWTVPLEAEAKAEGGVIPLLWARHRIRDLDSGVPPGDGPGRRRTKEQSRKHGELVALGKRYGLVSSATSYVAIEEGPGRRMDEPAQLRRIPVALTAGWGGHGSLMNGLRAQALTSSAFACCMPVSVSRVGVVKETIFSQRYNAMDRFAGDKLDCMPEEPPRGTGFAGVADRVFELLLTQHADGTFGLSDVLRTWLGPRAPRLEAAILSRDEAEVVTAVVVALLKAEASDRADEWRPAVKKAQRWLDHRPAFDPATILV